MGVRLEVEAVVFSAVVVVELRSLVLLMRDCSMRSTKARSSSLVSNVYLARRFGGSVGVDGDSSMGWMLLFVLEVMQEANGMNIRNQLERLTLCLGCSMDSCGSSVSVLV